MSDSFQNPTALPYHTHHQQQPPPPCHPFQLGYPASEAYTTAPYTSHQAASLGRPLIISAEQRSHDAGPEPSPGPILYDRPMPPTLPSMRSVMLFRGQAGASQQQQQPPPSGPYPYSQHAHYNSQVLPVMPPMPPILACSVSPVSWCSPQAPPILGGLPVLSDLRMIMSGGVHRKEIRRRTKTGCLTCRKRRIKCDEKSFPCSNCNKSRRECRYDPAFKPNMPPARATPSPVQAGPALPADTPVDAADSADHTQQYTPSRPGSDIEAVLGIFPTMLTCPGNPNRGVFGWHRGDQNSSCSR